MTARLSIEISIKTPRWSDCLPDAAALAQHAAQMAWQRCGDNRSDTELSIVLGDDSLLLSLNGRYRNKNEPTNILSFPADDDALPEMPCLLGDVVLAFETIYLEAKTQDKSFADHFQPLCIHGVLHLLGHDHKHETEAAVMEALEIAILSAMEVSNPYANPPMKRPT